MSASPFTIGPVGSDGKRVAQALAVLREGLGHDFITDVRFRWYAEAPGDAERFRAALAATDEATGGVIGALTIEIVDALAISESFLDHDALVRDDVELRLLQPGATGLIKSIAVAADAQGRGVATALIAQGIRALAERGASHFYSLAWVSDERGCALCGPLLALGFRPARRIERFWYDDSLAKGYRCPSCGNPCQCAAQVMVL